MITEADLTKFEKLTKTELEVLKHLCDGHVNKVIADKIYVSDHTVKFHVNNIMRKLKSQTRTEAAVKAVRLKIVP